MNENLNKTLKSVETEDWLDLHVVRPFCYYWAVPSSLAVAVSTIQERGASS